MADQVADLSPLENGYFRFLLIESYSEWRCGRPCGRSTPLRMAILDSYSEEVKCGRPGGRWLF